MRVAVDIPERQLAELTALAKCEGVSRASLVRRAVADLLALKRKASAKDAIAAAFGLWADLKEDSLAIERRLRDEWEREWDEF